jgi:O-antigen ligase
MNNAAAPDKTSIYRVGAIVAFSLLGLTWLIPPQLYIWTTLPSDAWFAFVSIIGVIVISLFQKTKSCFRWSRLNSLIAALIAVCWIQYLFGLLPFAGQAWVSSLYLLGFLLALLFGENYTRIDPFKMLDVLFISISLAGLISVFIQLNSWISVSFDPIQFSVLSVSTSTRPSANLAQPNQLSSLLIWSSIGMFWGHARGVISIAQLIAGASYLAFGIALTNSRSGFMAFTLFIAAIIWYRRIWSSSSTVKAGIYIYLAFIMSFLLIGWLNRFALNSQEAQFGFERSWLQRWEAWQMFAAAILKKPLFGYGFYDVAIAQLSMTEYTRPMGLLFTKSHNLFLDFLLWFGVPVGLGVASMICIWVYQSVKRIQAPTDLLLMLCVFTIAVHSMVEFPLHYAYFLIPLGFICGAINLNHDRANKIILPRRFVFAGVGIAFFCLGVVIHDYRNVRHVYMDRIIENSVIGAGRISQDSLPSVTMLTQLRAWMYVDYLVPKELMTDAIIEQAENVAYAMPSVGIAYRTAKIMALNNRPTDARAWLLRACMFGSRQDCNSLKKEWADQSRSNRLMSVVSF